MSDLPAPSLAFAQQLEGLLDKLVPADSITVQTVDGRTLTLPGALPARLQVRVFRQLRELLSRPEVAVALGGMAGAGGFTMSKMVDAVVLLATDEQLATGLGGIFSTAYPNLLPAGQDPLDVLPLEELVRAMVPFSGRFVRELGRGVTALAGAVPAPSIPT